MSFLSDLFEKPPYPPDLKNEVENLIGELITVGKNDDFLSERPGAGFTSQCRNIRARAIGKRLDDIGGLALMQWASRRIRKKCGKKLGEHLDYAWADIGTWFH